MSPFPFSDISLLMADIFFQTTSNTTKALQLGLISRGQKCARINRPGIYTKISAFSDWIVENTKDGGCSKFI